MPNPAKGPRLAIRTDRGRSTFIIRDGSTRISTGICVEDREQAERALANYLDEKWSAPSAPASSRKLEIAEVLAIYGAARMDVSSPKTIGYCIKALLPFWGRQKVCAVKGATCRLYAKQRGVSDGTVRRELGVLNAALQYCVSEGYLTEAPRVSLPQKPPPRERWLTRSEAARLLNAARPWPHLTRFILLSLYTGSRSAVVRRLQWDENFQGGHVDLENGVLYRLSAVARRTKKRAPIARIPRKLLNHLRRWRRLGVSRNWIVEWDGKPVGSLKRTWRQARESAGLGPDVVPHILRHTAITWMLQRGASPAHVSSLAGITLSEMEETYMHHSPDHQKSALDALDG